MENRVNANNKKRKNTKRRLLILALIVSMLAIIAAGTLAFFTDEETNYNVITTGSLDLDLVEEIENGEPWPEDGFDNIEPGMDVTKIAYVENCGPTDAYVRVSLDKKITPAEGIDAELNFDHITLDINTTDWTERDGYYYYNKVVKPGEETEPIFTNVHFGVELGNEYMNAKVEITVNMQAVQAQNNGNSALEAAGWPEN